MTDLDIYQPAAGIGQYQPGIVMTPEAAKALDEQVRLCTAAVLREGVDYGHIPGTSGDEKTLYRPGAQKLLQWFRLECTCERVEVERDDEGRKHGITYRAEVGRGLKTATPVILATCEGTADYDESKFHQDVEQVRARLRDAEHKWAAKDRRVPNADRWNNAKEYRADWNALMKRAQKRAIVGAVVDATAAGGIFTDREEDETPAPQDDGPAWYEQALEDALGFTDKEAGRKLFVEAAQAARDGLCTPRQAGHIQNRIKQREQLLKTATPADAEDLAREAAGDADGQKAPPRTARRGKAAGDAAGGQQPKAGTETPRPDGDPGAHLPPPPGDDEPADPAERHSKLVGAVQGQLKRLGFAVSDDDREERVITLARLAQVAYDPDKYASTNDFEEDELRQAAATLARCRNRDALDTLLTAGEVDD